jgi:hypothetical protein
MGDPLRDCSDGGGAARFGESVLQFDQLTIDGREAEVAENACGCLVEVDGPGNVIDRADPEALDLALLGVAGGDEDDGGGTVFLNGLEPSADLDAVELGHYDIEQDEVWPMIPHGGDRRLARVGGNYGQILAFQSFSQDLNVDRLVVDNENRGGSHAR